MQCNYIDDYHLRLDNRVFHICELAKMFERKGNIVKSLDDKEINSKKKNRNYER